MPTVLCIVCDEATKNQAVANNTDVVQVFPRQIDNTAANSLGHGTLVGLWVMAASMLINPEYVDWQIWFGNLNPQPPIYYLNTEDLFIPEED